MNRNEHISDIISAIGRIKRGLQGRTYSCDDSMSLTGTQLSLMFTLSHMETMSASDIAKHLYLTPGAVSQNIEVLQQHGLINRTQDPENRRSYDLALTPKARSQLESMLQERRVMFESITHDLSDADLKLLSTILDRLATALHNQPVTQKGTYGKN